MSLIPYSADDLFFGGGLWPWRPHHHHYSLVPNREVDALVSDSLDRIRQIERLVGQQIQNQCDMEMGENGPFRFRCNVAGYKPEELSVDLEGSDLVVKGEHKDTSEGNQSLHRTFHSRVRLPEAVKKDSLECSLDEKGRLEIRAERQPIPEDQKRNIPIGQGENDNNGQQQQLKNWVNRCFCFEFDQSL